jgi:23S rRNA (guanosine2251-2'-O)-methyltransferase
MPRNDKSFRPNRSNDRRPDPRTEKRTFHKPQGEKPTGLWIYGNHAVRAALANPKRHVKKVVLTERAAEEIGKTLLAKVRHEIVDMDTVSKLLPAGSVHQGAAMNCEPLPRRELRDVLPESGGKRRIVLVLDQITDPHNAGAILRSAAAFGVAAVVVQDRHAPPESGVLAKAASGALDSVPYIEVVNISRVLDELAELGFWRIALAGDGEQTLREAVPETGDVALILGSEGSGIRRLVREHCDTGAYIPIARAMESLNVSNAAAVALYELNRR